jgi:hypothetical protein
MRFEMSLGRLLEIDRLLGGEIGGFLALALNDRVDALAGELTASLAASRASARLTSSREPSPIAGRRSPSR